MHLTADRATIFFAFCVIMQYTMRTRSSPKQMQSRSVEALQRALQALGVDSQHTPDDGQAALIVRSPSGVSFRVEVKAASVATADWVSKLDPHAEPRPVVVAEQIPSRIRQDLSSRGIAWLDLRGHIRLVDQHFFIDSDVPPPERTRPAPRNVITGRSGLAASIALLMHPDEPTGVSDVARKADLNPSSVSRAMSMLTEAQLAERLSRGKYRPLVPELFWELVDVWPTTRLQVHLSNADLSNPRLNAGLLDVNTAGWAMSGERGAVIWGAPLTLTADYPTQLYVPDREAIRVARIIRSDAQPAIEGSLPPMELAVDPVGLLTRERYPAKGAGTPLAHPVVCALDLAMTSRGREALDQWDPPEGFIRVW